MLPPCAAGWLRTTCSVLCMSDVSFRHIPCQYSSLYSRVCFIKLIKREDVLPLKQVLQRQLLALLSQPISSSLVAFWLQSKRSHSFPRSPKRSLKAKPGTKGSLGVCSKLDHFSMSNFQPFATPQTETRAPEGAERGLFPSP